MVTTLKENLTYVIFGSALLLSALSIFLLLAAPDRSLLLTVAAGSTVFNLWSVYRSENGGFVKKQELRRAYEPPRHFNGLQMLLLIGLVMAQLSLGLFSLARI